MNVNVTEYSDYLLVEYGSQRLYLTHLQAAALLDTLACVRLPSPPPRVAKQVRKRGRSRPV